MPRWNGQRMPAAGQATSAWTRSGLSSRLSWRTAVRWNGIKLSANRFTYMYNILATLINCSVFMSGGENNIWNPGCFLSQSRLWLTASQNNDISQLGQEEGMLSPEGKKIPTRGVGASRIKQQQAATPAMCMCIFCQHASWNLLLPYRYWMKLFVF